MKERTCTKCGSTGVEGDLFYKGQGNCCKHCARRLKSEWQKRIHAEGGVAHERRKEQIRVSAAKRKFGITAERAKELYSATACEVCGGVNESGRRLNIDHCHVTGRVRGVLCNRCNRGIGFFKDDADLLRAASLYLER